jgi:hypothetical protein
MHAAKVTTEARRNLDRGLTVTRANVCKHRGTLNRTNGLG